MHGKTLKLQLTLITVLPLLFTIVIVSALVLNEFLKNIEHELDKRARDISSHAVKMSEFHFYTGDVDGLAEVADILMKIDGLERVRFIDGFGQLLIQRRHNNVKDKLREYVFPVHATEIAIEDFPPERESPASPEILGTIELALSEQGTASRRYQAYLRILLISGLSLLFGIALALLFNRKLTSSISSLLTAAQDIEQRKFDTRCEENGTGELLQFQKTFNKMAESFQMSEREMQEKIQAATESLHDTVQELSEKNQELDRQRQETIDLERSKAISDERERIMKDMHDGIGGQLVASLALLEQEPASESKRNITTVLAECLDDLRMIINSLDVHNDSLSALLADFKYRMSKKLDQLNIDLSWHIDDIADTIVIQPEKGLHLLRILQEAFTNILKHADASTIEFRLVELDNTIQILIKDNGHFAGTDHVAKGHGIANMHFRATKLNGILDITPVSSGGCCLSLTLPLSTF